MLNDDHLTTETILDYIDFRLPVHQENSVQEHLTECEMCRQLFHDHLVIASGLVGLSQPPQKWGVAEPQPNSDSEVPARRGTTTPLYRLVDRVLQSYAILERFAQSYAWTNRTSGAGQLIAWVKMCILERGTDDEFSHIAPTPDQLVALTDHLSELLGLVTDDPRYRVYPLRALAAYLTQDENIVAEEFMAAFVASDLILKRLGGEMDRAYFSPILEAIERYLSDQ